MKIGLYYLGAFVVRLDGKPGGGGDFDMGRHPQALMRIGLGDRWGTVVESLLHEAFEMACAARGLRWFPSPDYSESHAAYQFVLSHEQMAEVMGQVGWFVSKCLPDLAKAYSKAKEWRS